MINLVISFSSARKQPKSKPIKDDEIEGVKGKGFQIHLVKTLVAFFSYDFPMFHVNGFSFFLHLPLLSVKKNMNLYVLFPGSVLLVSNLDESSTTPNKLFTLFGVYGDVVRVKILYQKKHTALIQFVDAPMADTARKFLDGVVVFGKPISVKTSKHSSVALPKGRFLYNMFSIKYG